MPVAQHNGRERTLVGFDGVARRRRCGRVVGHEQILKFLRAQQIRRRIMEKFPEARQAFLDRKAATKKGDIGIENADPESIREALRKAHGSFDAKPAAPVFLQKDLLDAGLIGQADSAARREKLGKILGIGYGNGKVMLQRLNSFGIERDAFEQAVQEL